MERNGSMALTLLPHEKCRKPWLGSRRQPVGQCEIRIKTAEKLVPVAKKSSGAIFDIAQAMARKATTKEGWLQNSATPLPAAPCLR